MKKFLIICSILITSNIYAQWVQKYSDPYQYYTSIFFVDSLNGFVSGYPYPGAAFTLKTTDAGESWTQSDINSTPSSLSFINNSIGFCATFNGIYKTIDGGTSWNLSYQDENHFSSIEFLNESIGWAGGYSAISHDVYFYKTQDGGNNWDKKLIGTELSEPKVEMLNELNGFIIAKSKIFKTSDGGDSWTVAYEDTIPGHSFWAISFSDELNGFVGGAGTDLILTSDGGNNWHSKFIPIPFCTNIKAVANNFFVSGFGVNYSSILYSTNFGENWTPILVDDSSDIHNIFFVNVNNGWFCATTGNAPPFYNGFIYKTENAWFNNISSPSAPLQIFPQNGSNYEQSIFNFEWEKLEYCLYRFQLSNDSLFNTFYVIVNPATGDTTFYGNILSIENNKLVAVPLNQKFYWRIRSENLMGVSDWSETRSFTTYSPASTDQQIIPSKLELFQNFPNPFNPSTVISFSIPYESHIILKIYDVLGNEIATLMEEEKTAGTYEVGFNASGLSSGIYFYTLNTESFSNTKKMVVLK